MNKAELQSEAEIKVKTPRARKAKAQPGGMGPPAIAAPAPIATPPAPGKETPSEAFKRLANKRLGTLKDSFRVLGGLANKTNYTYTPEQVDTILMHAGNMLIELAKTFKNDKVDKGEFL